jgi:sulfate transport system permease protein
VLRVTLPKVRWGILYDVILCNASHGRVRRGVRRRGSRARRDQHDPLQVEILYNEYNRSGAFAVASILTILALVTLVAKKLIELQIRTHRP